MADLKNLLKTDTQELKPKPKSQEQTTTKLQDPQSTKSNKSPLRHIIAYGILFLLLFVGFKSRLLHWQFDYLDYYLYVLTGGVLVFLLLNTFDSAKKVVTVRSIAINLLITVTAFFTFTLGSHVASIFVGEKWEAHYLSFILISILIGLLMKCLRKRHVIILILIIILNLVASYGYYIQYHAEVKLAKDVLLKIYTGNTPDTSFIALMDTDIKKTREYQELFYILKVWLIKAQASEADIMLAYPTWAVRDNGGMRLYLYYGNSNPVIEFALAQSAGKHRVRMICFPFNSSRFSADLNNDSKYDAKDVSIAREQVHMENR